MAERKSSLQSWNTIRNRIFFSILLFLIVPFSLTFYYIDKPLESAIERKIGDSAREALYQVNFNVGLFLDDMLKSVAGISMNASITAMLQRPEDFSEYDKLRLQDTITNKLYSSYFTDTYVTLMDMRGNWYSSRYIDKNMYNEYVNASWYGDMLKSPYQIKWMINNKSFTYADKESIITMVKTVTDFQTSQNIGMLVFSVPEKDIRKYFTNLEGELYLLDETGTVVSGSHASKAGASFAYPAYLSQIFSGKRGQIIMEKDRTKWIANYDTVSQTGWKLVQVTKYDTVFKEIFDIRRANIAIFALIFIVFIGITYSISYSISRPVKLLNKRMQELEEKQFNSGLSESGPQEIVTLIGSYNKMVKQIRELIQRQKEQFQQKEDMRFRALQAQINPHFILNTLNNIKWMAYIRNNHDVGEMLSSLGSIMEASIGREGSLITLRQEIAYIENYIALMKLKYNEKLSVRYEIPEELYDCEAIKFMLQPIVENSIVHGIDQSNGLGEITIEAMREHDRLIVVVHDNGAGIEPDKLAEFRRSLSEPSDDRPLQRIGIRNVHDRIRLQYGEAYGLEIESDGEAGTTVKLVVPFKTHMGGDGYAAEGHAGR
ncbi:sensor histidine kinase [Paenibacillus sp. MBLB4367]|uniref:sensor histidine kinase n=1 Tax=Paenibacillus sp. MBLB4367 TaxID=3384767 RepID=UPI00390832E9